MKTRTQILLIMAIAVIAVIGACNKSVNSNKGNPGSDVRSQLMTATNSLNQFSSADDADYDMANGTGEFAGSGLTPSCFTITFDPSKNVYPHTKTIDFTGCPLRSGKIIITVYQPAGSDGVLSSRTYDNFYFDGIHIEGTVVDSGAGGSVYHMFNKTLTAPNNDVKTWHGTFVTTKIQFNGEDAVQITGSANGKENINGLQTQHFKATIVASDPVIRVLSCHWRSKGSVSVSLVTAHGEEIHTHEIINYGDGTCDDTAWITIDGETPFSIALPLIFF